MARGFLPVDTSGISQGISDAASGLRGWLSNAFTTPDSVVQSRQQHRDTWRGGPDAIAQAQGFYDADQKDIADRVYSSKMANALRSGLNTVFPIDDYNQEGWLPNLKTYNVPLAAELGFEMNPTNIDGSPNPINPLAGDGRRGAESYNTLAHILMEADPRSDARLRSRTYGWMDRAFGGDTLEEIRREEAVKAATKDILEQDVGKGPRPFVTTKGHPHLESLLEKVENEIESDMITPPLNLGQTHEGTLQSFFNIPEEPTGSIIPVSHVEGGMKGFIEDGVQTDYEPRDVMPEVDIASLLADDHVDRMPDLFNLPISGMGGIEEQTVFDSTTPGQIGDYLRAQEQEFMLPSGPEEMYIPFEQEQETIDREDREAQRRIDDLRKSREADERQAQKLREQVEHAEEDDRQYKAMKMKEAEEKERQANEKAEEEQAIRDKIDADKNAKDLLDAADKLEKDNKEKEEEAGRQQLKELEEFMARQAADRAFRKREMKGQYSFF